MFLKAALPLLALLTAACAASQELPRPIPTVAEMRHCPAYPLPPEELLKAPEKTDFLDPNG